MLYMVTFTINIPQMLAYIPYMDPMGNRGPKQASIYLAIEMSRTTHRTVKVCHPQRERRWETFQTLSS